MLEREAAPLRVQAVNTLRKMIAAGEYPPGTRLTEKLIGDGLGVSRTVVRESLRQLETEKLIMVEPNVGPVVRRLTPEEVVHLYETRGMLATTASAFAASRATPEQIGKLRRIVALIPNHADDVPIPTFLEIKDQFYTTLTEASGNTVLGDILSNVQARISTLRSVTLSSPGRRFDTIGELERIIDAIEAGDAKAAAEAAQAHIDAAARIAIDHTSVAPSKTETVLQ